MSSTDDYDRYAREIRTPALRGSRNELDAREIVRCATLAASSHNTQPWKFRFAKRSITILPDYSRRCPVVDPDDSHLFTSLGCAAENMVYAAAAQNHTSHVTFNAKEESVVVHFAPARSILINDLFLAIPKRQCTKKVYEGGTLKTAEVKALEGAGRGNGVRTIMLTSDLQLRSMEDYVVQGDKAQFTDLAFCKELESWIRFNTKDALRTCDGLSGRTIGNPPLPSWLAKMIIEFVLTLKAQIKKDVDFIRSSSGIAVFTAKRDDKAAWVEIGRVYERFALRATALGIRNSFLNQPIEVYPLRPQLESWLGLKNEYALLIARVGRGPLAPFSLRRPIDEVIV